MIERVGPKAIRFRALGYLVTVVDNRPTWALTAMTWRWADAGRRCWRVRLGPIKAQGQHAGCTEGTA